MLNQRYTKKYNYKEAPSENKEGTDKYIFCIIGDGGVGKDTICKKLIEKDKRLTFLCPITTRPMRVGEQEGVDYNFITDAEFNRRIANNELLEHRSYNVCSKDSPDEIWQYGHPKPSKNYNVLVGPIKLYKNLCKMYKDQEYLIIPILIWIKQDERLYRMIVRESKEKNPNYREVARRFVADIQFDSTLGDVYESLMPNSSFENVGSIDNTVDNIIHYIDQWINMNDVVYKNN